MYTEDGKLDKMCPQENLRIQPGQSRLPLYNGAKLDLIHLPILIIQIVIAQGTVY